MNLHVRGHPFILPKIKSERFKFCQSLFIQSHIIHIPNNAESDTVGLNYLMWVTRLLRKYPLFGHLYI